MALNEYKSIITKNKIRNKIAIPVKRRRLRAQD